MVNEVVISSGHAKHVSGASSIIDEVTEARKVVNQTVEYLEELGCVVHEYHDDTSKTQRDNINRIVKHHDSKKRDLDISVHFNANKKTEGPMGVEVLYLSEAGGEFAEKVSLAISKASGLKNRGPKKRTNLGFLNGTDETAILIEVCFVDSEADVELYKKNFDEICRAIAETVTGKKLTVVKKAATKKKVTKKYTSLVDYLAANHQPYDFVSRVQLAKKHGIKGYNGTADQNTKLLTILQK